MSGRRRRSKRLETVGPEGEEVEQSFRMEEIKENLHDIGGKLQTWLIEDVQSDRRKQVEEISVCLRQMRNFLITKKKRVEHSKSSRQLKQLETFSPLLDSANDLSSVANDYLNKIQENRGEVQLQEHEEVDDHESSFVDMFLDESQENAGRKSKFQNNTFTEENTENTNQSLTATPSRSILKTPFNQTPGIQKKISFANKATKVYEDNQTSQISLAKSSGSVKGDSNQKAQNAQRSAEMASNSEITLGTQKSNQEDSRQDSEDMFDDTESIVDTSFQEEVSGKPKSVKVFKAKQLMDFSQVKSITDDSSNYENRENFTQNDPQAIELDSLLSQESTRIKQNASESMKDQPTDTILPFHNFVLTLPHDSSGSEGSLDARVNMAINLVNMKPNDSDMKPQLLPDKVETPNDYTNCIVPSSVTWSDFRRLEPKDFTQGTSQGSSKEEIQHYPERKCSAKTSEDGISSKNLLTPFDIQNENKIKIPEPGVLGVAHPQRNLMFPKPTWANPFQTSIGQLSSTFQAVQIKPVAKEPENSIKDKFQSMILNKNRRNTTHTNIQAIKTPNTKEQMPKIGKIETEAQQQLTQEQLSQSKMAKKSESPQNLLIKRAKMMSKDSTFTQGTQRPNVTVNILQETFDSHEVAKAAKFKTRQSFKQALKDAVKNASLRQTVVAQKHVPADSKIDKDSKEQQGLTFEAIQENSKTIALWNDSSLPHSKIIPNKNQSNLNFLNETLMGKSKSIKGEREVNTKIPRKRKPRTKLKPSQEGAQTASSNEHPGKIHSNDEVSVNQHSTPVVREIKTKDENGESSNKLGSTPLGTKWDNNSHNLTETFNLFLTSTAVPDTILVEKAQAEGAARSVNLFPSRTTPLPDTILEDTVKANIGSGNDTAGGSHMNTSSMICETSSTGEKASQGHRKLTNTSQKKNQPSQNQLKAANQKTQAQLKLSRSNKPVTKRGRGRLPKSVNRENLAKKYEKNPISESVFTSNSYFEPQPVGQFDCTWFSNMSSNVQHLPAQQGLQSSNQDSHQAKERFSQDFQKVQTLRSEQDSEQTEPFFLKFQQLHIPQTSLEPQSFNKSRNSASGPGHVFQTKGWQEPTQQNLFSSKQEPAQNEGFLTFQQQALTHSSTPLTNPNGEPVQCVSMQNESRLFNLQQDNPSSKVFISNNQEGEKGSFYETQPENSSNTFVQLFNQPSNVENLRHNTRTVFNLPSTFQNESSNKIFSTAMDQDMKCPQLQQTVLQPQALNGNPKNLSQMNSACDGIKYDIREEKQRTAEEVAPLLKVSLNIDHHMTERPAEKMTGSQTKKRAGKQAKKKLKSPKMIKLDKNETLRKDIDNLTKFLETEVPMECDNLSWVLDDFPDIKMFDDDQMINTEMFNTQIIDTHIFNSQPLSQNAGHPAASKSFQTAGNEYNRTEDEHQYTHTQLSCGSTMGHATPSFPVPENQENCKHHDNHAGIKGTNSKNILNEQCGNTQFRQQDPKHSAAVQNLSETYQVSFTEFKRGVQVTSTEQTENRKTPRSAIFKEPTKKKRGKKNKQSYGPSSDSAGTEQTSANTTQDAGHALNQDGGHAPCQQDAQCLSETQSPTNWDQTAYNDFSRMLQKSSTELSPNRKTLEPAEQKTEAEEIDELIKSIKWVRQIPASELIQAANIDELINDQTFVW